MPKQESGLRKNGCMQQKPEPQLGYRRGPVFRLPRLRQQICQLSPSWAGLKIRALPVTPLFGNGQCRPWTDRITGDQRLQERAPEQGPVTGFGNFPVR